MAEPVNDLISLIASQDQTGCSPSTLTLLGKASFSFFGVGGGGCCCCCFFLNFFIFCF